MARSFQWSPKGLWRHKPHFNEIPLASRSTCKQLGFLAPVKAGMMTVFSDVISFAPNSSLTLRDYAFEKMTLLQQSPLITWALLKTRK